MKQKILEILKTGNIKFASYNDMVLFFAGKFTKTPKEVGTLLKAMLSRGEIFEDKKGQYKVADKNYIKGKIAGTTKGYAFLMPLDKNLSDFFIPKHYLKGALDGDLVLAKIVSFTEDSTECQVVSVLENANTKVVGTITYINKKDALVVPDNKKLDIEIFVPQKLTKNAKNNQRVVVQITKRNNKRVSGEVVEVLGASDDIYSLELGIIREHRLYETFPSSVQEEAEKIPQKVTNIFGRVDLRNKKIFTIDGADARDFDDAVSIEKQGEFYILGVHIADVGEYVKVGSNLDEEAYTRGTSVYFPNMVLPMLPVQLSNGICSLNENQDRYTLSVEMKINKDGIVVEHKIYESVIKSCHRLTYDEAYDVICGKHIDKLSDIEQDLITMNELSKIIEKRRTQNGALDLDIPESEIAVDENFNVTFLSKRERNDAHKLIENFMIIANETVAKHFCEQNIPFVYRVHEKPVQEKVASVCSFLEGLGVVIPKLKVISPKYIQKLLELTKDKEYSEVANKVILRSLQKARYLDENLGHFGLSLENYCHFTSPIRRYPDLCIHRIIKQCLHSKLTKSQKEQLSDFVLDASFRSSETEKNADEAERDVDDLFKAVYIKNYIGETFEGIISGVTNYGFYVQLENTVEGLVKIEDLPQDNYLYFEKSLKLKGNSHIYSLGDKVKVKVVNVNLSERKVDFVLSK